MGDIINADKFEWWSIVLIVIIVLAFFIIKGLGGRR